jgi:twitching motility protein PilT
MLQAIGRSAWANTAPSGGAARSPETVTDDTHPLLDDLLAALLDLGGSDLHLTEGAPPLLRIDGRLTPLAGYADLDVVSAERLVLSAVPEKLLADFRVDKTVDFSFAWRGRARFRANAFLQKGCPALALRLVPATVPSMADIRAPAVLDRLVDRPHGLILVTGPTGSGKSTTQAAMIGRINERRSVHILTIEDPIEYVHTRRRAAINQREVGVDVNSFSGALRSALREDPDVLLVGEMRDLETIQFALTLAETGHLVFATLHTNDTAQVVERLVDVFPASQQAQITVQVASTLSAVVHQRLVPRIGGGRVAAYEVLVATPAVRNLVREGKGRQLRNVLTTGHREGMQTLEAALSGLVAEGLVSYEDAVAHILFPEEIRRP